MIKVLPPHQRHTESDAVPVDISSISTSCGDLYLPSMVVSHVGVEHPQFS